MNPAEGQLRSQIMDRFGLRAVVRGLPDAEMRYQVYQRAVSYYLNPEKLSDQYSDMTLSMAQQIEDARQRLPQVGIGEDARRLGLGIIRDLEIDSGRAEITLFEAARAYCAADERDEVTAEDIKAVANTSTRLRQSNSLRSFFEAQEAEDRRLQSILDGNSQAAVDD
jgi:magnesium chelatase subunit I